MKKKFLLLFSLLFAVLFFLIITGIIIYYNKTVSYNDRIISDVGSEIRINRDNKGIPEIRASSMEDLYYAMGYVHAQDRILLMEYYRAIANGNISRLIGKEGEILERISSITGIAEDSEEIVKKLNPESGRYLESYVRGINLLRKQGLSINTFKRDWVPQDVIRVFLLREWSNAYLNNIENIFQLPLNKKKLKLSEAFPVNLVSFYSEDEEESLQILRNIGKILKKYVGTFGRGIGFFTGHRLERKGDIFTAFNLDCTSSVYPCIYPLHAVVGNKIISGITCAGMPFILLGKNSNISFLGFNLDTDTQDFFIEKVRTKDNMQQYLSSKGWREFKAVNISLPLNGNNASDKNDTIWRTENGAVLNDIFVNGKYGSNAVTLRSILPDERYIDSLFKLPVAESVNEAKKIVRSSGSMPRVYIFSSGNTAAKVYSGKFSLRSANMNVFFKGYRKFRNRHINIYRSVKIKRRGAAAGSQLFTDAPAVIRKRSRSVNNRFLRIGNLLASGKELNETNVRKYLSDTYSKEAGKYLPVLLSILNNNPITSARLSRIYFKRWDYTMDTDQVSPSIFQTLLYNFIHVTYADEFPESIDVIMENYHFLTDVFFQQLKKNRSAFFDDISTEVQEDREMNFDRAFLITMRKLNRNYGPVMSNWKWGLLHKGHYHIPIEDTAFIGTLFYNIEDSGIKGGNDSIFSGGGGNYLTPVDNTALSAYFSKDHSGIYMNFSGSINPMSGFSYGKYKDTGFSFFKTGNTDFRTIILPLERSGH